MLKMKSNKNRRFYFDHTVKQSKDVFLFRKRHDFENGKFFLGIIESFESKIHCAYSKRSNGIQMRSFKSSVPDALYTFHIVIEQMLQYRDSYCFHEYIKHILYIHHYHIWSRQIRGYDHSIILVRCILHY